MLSSTYMSLGDKFYKKIKPEKFFDPMLIAFNEKLATELKLDFHSWSKKDLALYFSGQKLFSNSSPIALVYAGYQFGHPVSQLGDGRAHLLGESNGYDIQLKGAGRTPFSRNGDGRSALGPVLREYIVSEAMHSLGIPTSRALAAVTTGEEILRHDGPGPGGIFTRVASSHIRVGTFQYFYMKQDFDGLKKLLNYCVSRHYPEFEELQTDQKAIEFIKALSIKQGELIAQWTSFGFIHGVMNTDNFSIAGITIDYGPCAFMDEFKFNKVFSSIDHHGRYSFFNQVPIAQWNILRLADCLLPLIHKDQARSVSIMKEHLNPILQDFHFQRMKQLGKKFGIFDYQDADESLIMEFLKHLEDNSLDFTISFRKLPQLHRGDGAWFSNDTWIKKWKQRVQNVDTLDSINPLYIPRNHQIQKAIDQAYQGDFSHFELLNKVLSSPFQELKDLREFALAPQVDEKVYQTFCGT